MQRTPTKRGQRLVGVTRQPGSRALLGYSDSTRRAGSVSRAVDRIPCD